jgi:hypothetical protein
MTNYQTSIPPRSHQGGTNGVPFEAEAEAQLPGAALPFVHKGSRSCRMSISIGATVASVIVQAR